MGTHSQSNQGAYGGGYQGQATPPGQAYPALSPNNQAQYQLPVASPLPNFSMPMQMMPVSPYTSAGGLMIQPPHAHPSFNNFASPASYGGALTPNNPLGLIPTSPLDSAMSQYGGNAMQKAAGGNGAFGHFRAFFAHFFGFLF